MNYKNRKSWKIIYGNVFICTVAFFILSINVLLAGPGNEKIEAILTQIENNMVLIPSGEFLMGGDLAANEYPPHKVYLDSYFIGKYEVTFEEYETYCKETGYNLPVDPRYFLQPDPSMLGPNMPVMNVGQSEAEAYCKWLSKKSGKHYRLPTEAEWEKAARGDLEGKEYPWGNEDPWADRIYRANYGPGLNQSFVWKKDGYKHTDPVGSYPPNGYGL